MGVAKKARREWVGWDFGLGATQRGSGLSSRGPKDWSAECPARRGLPGGSGKGGPKECLQARAPHPGYPSRRSANGVCAVRSVAITRTGGSDASAAPAARVREPPTTSRGERPDASLSEACHFLGGAALMLMRACRTVGHESVASVGLPLHKLRERRDSGQRDAADRALSTNTFFGSLAIDGHFPVTPLPAKPCRESWLRVPWAPHKPWTGVP